MNNMSYNDFDDITIYDKIKNIYWNGDSLYEFVNNYILRHPNKNILLQYLSEIYVLVIIDNTILNDEQKNIFKLNNNKFIIGFMLLDENIYYYNNDDFRFRFIDFIDTRINRLNIARFMMIKHSMIECEVLPQEIIDTSKYYWKKYFEDIHGVLIKSNLYELIRFYNLYNKVKWDLLDEIIPIEHDSE